MDLLSLARGPLLGVCLSIFVVGVVWRLVGLFLLRGRRFMSPARQHGAWKGISMTALRSWPRKEFRSAIALEIVSYTFHLGLFAAILLYLPHVLFFQDIVRGLLPFYIGDYIPFSWPTLSGNVIFAFSAVAVALLLAVVVHRVLNPVKRLISNFDDYFSWFVTITPLVTGMLAYAHLGGPYQTLLALHILSVELLLVWFPFGKLMHPFTMFIARGVTGVLFQRKGAPT